MSKHYEERYYVREEQVPSDFEEQRRPSSRKRSSSRSRNRSQTIQDDSYYRQRVNRSGSGSSISSVSDYDYRNQSIPERPLVRLPRDVIRAPTPPPVIQRVVERAPTPEPDIVERVIVRPQPQQLIERIIERPRTPPPKIIDKEICEPAPPPIVRTRIVKVDHSPRHYMNSNTIRYTQSPHAQAASNYVSNDFDQYGYDRSYSTSYSTSELYPQPQGYSTGYNTSYQPSQVYQTQAVPNYNTQAVHQAYSQVTANPYGYTYGYRPAQAALSSATAVYPSQYGIPSVYPRPY